MILWIFFLNTPLLTKFGAKYLENLKSWKFTFVMQHVGLTVNNIYPKFYKILRTFKKDRRSQREFLFFSLETGREETGGSKAYFARYRLVSLRWCKMIFQTSSGFPRILYRNVSRKRIITRILFGLRTKK